MTKTVIIFGHTFFSYAATVCHKILNICLYDKITKQPLLSNVKSSKSTTLLGGVGKTAVLACYKNTHTLSVIIPVYPRFLEGFPDQQQ